MIYSIRITNTGRTPAHILHFRINCSFLEEGVELKSDTPHEVIEDREFMKLLDTHESDELDQPTIDVRETVTNLVVKHSGIEPGRPKRVVTFWGWVKYRHMFSTDKTCYADFCYVYIAEESGLATVGKYTRQREELE
jgi:hypothetical protein